jgi:glycosyltransferase involved in cell wall biosynthesis
VAIPTSRDRVNCFFIPDLTTLLFPDWHLPAVRGHWQAILERARSCGDVIVTCSNHSKQDIERSLGIEADRIVVAPLAADDGFTPNGDAGTDRVALQAWGLEPGRYILSVGTLEPRKNHVRLVEAFDRLRKKGLSRGVPLVLAGARGWMYEPLLETIRRLDLGDHVRLMGHADPLAALYRGASVMVYPSLYEGFGLPPLEAMACGTPVITSSASSLPEVVGDAGLLVDPHDPDALTDAMATVLSDDRLRSRMRENGLARAATFSWARTAAATEAAYERAFALRRSG